MDTKTKMTVKKIAAIIIIILGFISAVISPVLSLIIISIGVLMIVNVSPAERIAKEKDIVRIQLPYEMTIHEIYEKIKDIEFEPGKPFVCRTAFVNTDCIVWGPYWQFKFIYATWRS